VLLTLLRCLRLRLGRVLLARLPAVVELERAAVVVPPVAAMMMAAAVIAAIAGASISISMAVAAMAVPPAPVRFLWGLFPTCRARYPRLLLCGAVSCTSQGCVHRG